MKPTKLSHVHQDGSLAMVDVGGKAPTQRTAIAEARVRMNADAAQALHAATLAKGDAFAAAQLAGIMAAKRTSELIPLAHPIPIGAVDVAFAWEVETTLLITTRAVTVGQTGVEMEAMVAASVAALTVYDMCKALDKGIVIEQVRLIEKTGGKSGAWRLPR